LLPVTPSYQNPHAQWVVSLVSGSASEMLYPLITLYLASLVFGWQWQSVSSWVAFGFSGACALAAMLLRVWMFLDGQRQSGA
jgi:hypothetical protein